MPNDTAYNETCASIGLVFWALRMFLMDGESQYADVIEQALYNGVLSGMSEDGNRFFYVNPLEVKPESCNRRHDKEHVMPVRQKWFKCACCPPNLARLMTSIGQYVYFQDEGGVGINLYAGSRYQYEAQGNPIQLEQKTNYPWEGTVSIAVGGASGQKFSLKLRKPGWCDSWKVMINGQEEQACLVKGYLTIDRSWIDGDRVELVMDMPVKTMYSLTELQENAGKAAVVRGPVVYCLEEADNGSNLSSLILKDDAHFHVEYDGSLLKGVSRITAKGVRETVAGESLYSDQAPRTEATDLKFIPYYAWNNRQDGEMLVWVRI